MARLFHNMAINHDSCIAALEAMGKETFPLSKNGVLWCNATWDSVLCWPAIPANASYSMPCPPLKGLDTEKHVRKRCHASGRWMGKTEGDFSKPSGWTDYISCMLLDHEAVEQSKRILYGDVDAHFLLENVTKHCRPSGRWMGKTADDFSRPQGWTNFSSCMTPVVKEILEQLGADAMQKAQEIARGARKLEFVGLTLSFVSLIVAISILAFFRRLRVFRNQIHLQLKLAILLTVVIRLILYIDLIFTEDLGTLQASDVGYTINTTKIICEAFYFLLEYGKTVAFAWMFIEGFYLHNTVVVTVFQEAPKLWKYLIIGWGFPLIHVTVWLLVSVSRREIERCLGSYYLHSEFWIMDAVRLAQLVVSRHLILATLGLSLTVPFMLFLANAAFLLNIVRVLWYKVKQTQCATESVQLKKSVKAALMLIPLLGIPNIMQTIPFTPTKHNIIPFAIFTYIASFFYMFQGFMVSVVYCFTNREVVHVIKAHYERYRLQHSTFDTLRRGSRAAAMPAFYHTPTVTNDPRLRPAVETNGLVPSAPTLPLLPPSYETVIAETMANGLQPTIANGHSCLPPDNNNHFSLRCNRSREESQRVHGKNAYSNLPRDCTRTHSALSLDPAKQQWQRQDPKSETYSLQETSPLFNYELPKQKDYKRAP